jgi:peptidoglycan/LPS O-acetylase OafA/YrhL
VATFGPQQDGVQQIWYGCIGGLIVLAAVSDGSRRSVRILDNRVLAWLGLISYGIFLWHYPIVLKLAAAGVHSFVPLLALGLVLPITIAAISYYAIESPFIRLKDLQSRRSRDAAAQRRLPEEAQGSASGAYAAG